MDPKVSTHVSTAEEIAENKDAILADIPKYMKEAYSKVIDRINKEQALTTKLNPIEAMEDMLYHLTIVTSHAGNLFNNMLIDAGAAPNPATMEQAKAQLDDILNQLMLKSQAISTNNVNDFEIGSPEEALVLYALSAKSILEMTFSDMARQSELDEKEGQAKTETDEVLANM